MEFERVPVNDNYIIVMTRCPLTCNGYGIDNDSIYMFIIQHLALIVGLLDIHIKIHINL